MQLFAFLAVFWSTAGLPPTPLASNRKCKGKQKQVPTSKDRLHLGGTCLGHTHHKVEGAGRSLGNPVQSLWWCQGGIAHNSVNSRSSQTLLGTMTEMIQIVPKDLKSASRFKKSHLCARHSGTCFYSPLRRQRQRGSP